MTEVVNTSQLFIYPKDLLSIYTHLRAYNSALFRYNNIKKMLGKTKHQYLTVKEFADWEGVSEEDIRSRIRH